MIDKDELFNQIMAKLTDLTDLYRSTGLLKTYPRRSHQLVMGSYLVMDIIESQIKGREPKIYVNVYEAASATVRHQFREKKGQLDTEAIATMIRYVYEERMKILERRRDKFAALDLVREATAPVMATLPDYINLSPKAKYIAGGGVEPMVELTARVPLAKLPDLLELIKTHSVFKESE